MARFKVFYGNGENDYAVIYVKPEVPLSDVHDTIIREFEKYNPDKEWESIVDYPEVEQTLVQLANEVVTNEHEFLLALIEAVQDAGYEKDIVRRLQEDYKFV